MWFSVMTINLSDRPHSRCRSCSKAGNCKIQSCEKWNNQWTVFKSSR
ncbi:hypothetical protein WN72_14190 [Bradyrhizobium arachidis]|uniref:Uncharacterized protein n=1 Tax=Bradyrhizobium arachidis TaxID=858423 RepID=A0AAE7NL23_9BRAD|nr:hypothetical protein WN72_14190 [Bradyrhizobium arachidis]